MNMDLDSAKGMQNAVTWMEGMMSHLNEGGVWMVPRSLSIYTVYPKQKKAERTVNGEACIDKVFKQMGWTLQ